MEYIIDLKDEINKSTADFVEMETRKAVEQKATSLTLIINSFGGSVYDGMSIISALKNTGLPTTARIEGYAASMAAIISLSCDRVEMAEHGILMFHNPYIEGVSEMSDSEKRAMELTANSLITLAARKISRKYLQKIMEKETWIDSSQAEIMGLVDEVYDINLLDKKGLTAEFNTAYVSKNQNLLNTIYAKLKNTMDNTEILTDEIKDETCVEIEITTKTEEEALTEKMLGLDGEEEESSIEEVQNMDETDYKSMYDELMSEFKKMMEKMDSMKNQIEVFENNEKALRLEKAVERVEQAISEGRIEESAKTEWVETLQNNYDLGVKMINTIKVSTKAPELPFMNKAVKMDERADWTIRDWETKDSQGLSDMLKNNKPLYKQLFKDYYKVEYKG